MRSSAAKLTLGVAAWIAFSAAAVFILQSEHQLTSRRNAVRAFDVVAREAAASLTAIKTAQQGYVAPGQGLGVWTSRVDGLLNTAVTRIGELQRVAATTDGRKTLADLGETLNDLRAIDKRARQYAKADQSLMAADVIFSEGGETAGLAARQVEAARHSEYVGFDASEGAARRQQVYTASGATGFAVMVIAVLMLWPTRGAAGATIVASPASDRSRNDAAGVEVTRISQAPEARPSEDTASSLNVREPMAAVAPSRPVSPDLPRDTVPVLTATAELCAELNRARDIDEITRLLARTAQVLDASGIVVWVGAPGGSMLRPVLAHGYSPQALARMPHVPRTGDNAAAAAFRTGKLQIVLSRPGFAGGALAAPMMSPNGCIGALTAEIKNGGETSDGVQALAAIFAAQLGGVLGESVLQSEEFEEHAPVTRIASA